MMHNISALCKLHLFYHLLYNIVIICNHIMGVHLTADYPGKVLKD